MSDASFPAMESNDQLRGVAVRHDLIRRGVSICIWDSGMDSAMFAERSSALCRQPCTTKIEGK